jgi:anion-transporting  ArsA/GET3 family ATPase
LFDRSLLVVSGKGGVGKSAITAALSILAARRGLSVLAMSMTDDLGLGAHLGVDRLGYSAQEIRPGVNALTIDRSRALDEYIRLQLHAPRIAPLGPVARGLNALADTVPGIRDIITIGKVLFEAGKPQWDIVIADAPPLGQITSYLRAPVTIAGLVPVGRVRDQALSYEHQLGNPDHTGLVLVATPEELPVVETNEARDEIAALVDIAAVVTNRVLDPLGVSEEKLAALPAGPHRDAGLLHRGLYGAQRRWTADLPDGPDIPFLFGVHTPGEVAVLIADSIGGTL